MMGVAGGAVGMMGVPGAAVGTGVTVPATGLCVAARAVAVASELTMIRGVTVPGVSIGVNGLSLSH
jgi:hypothetical protein